MTKEIKTRYGRSKEDIAQDFAEQLKYSLDADIYHTTTEAQYRALALAIRDRIIHQWDLSRKSQRASKHKRVYYLSLEFLMGRALTNNIINLGIEKPVRQALESLGYSLDDFKEEEPDAGLGNGGLGRLAACFLDSLATLEYPAYGYGIRYNYGIFRQQVRNGWQVEYPDNWLKNGNPWEVKRQDLTYPVYFGGRVNQIRENGRDIFKWIPDEQINGIAYDTPIVGYGGKTINTLRLWSAEAPEDFNFQEFNSGDYTEAVRSKVSAETISQVLYPNDTLYMGKELRLKQQYFFVTCSLQDILRRVKRDGKFDFRHLPEKAAIQMNDTHPSLAVAELMRLLVDEENLDWESAWAITVKTLGYTNHTLMPEALEKWAVPMFEKLLPRHLQIIYEINRRFLQEAISFFPLQQTPFQKVSIIEESNPKMIRMANLAIIGSHSTNGVAQIHSDLLKTSMFPEFNMIFPERFNNKTNGITQRRWLLDSNPELASLINSAIGDGWITDFTQISKLRPFAEDANFRAEFAKVKQNCKNTAADFLKKDCRIIINPETLIDTQVKRIHEYKRQLMNALNVLMIYNELKSSAEMRETFPPMTFLFGGKAAPGYVNAKLIIKFINSIASIINKDPQTNKLLQIYFMPNYRVSMAEKIIPATNISEQISTAGLEASGTSNMKFMINGALTMGTLDGANIEIAEEAGLENCFIFGHTEAEITELKKSYNPYETAMANDKIRGVLELVDSGFFNKTEPGIFEPLRRSLLSEDRYCIFADLPLYHEAHAKARELYKENQDEWNRKAIINIASSSKFSSDRTIEQYAKEIWNLEPCHVKKSTKDTVLSDASLK